MCWNKTISIFIYLFIFVGFHFFFFQPDISLIQCATANAWASTAQEVGTSESLGQVWDLPRGTFLLKNLTGTTAKVRKQLRF